MSDFTSKVRTAEYGIVTYGMTPPKVGTDAARLVEVAKTQTGRLSSVNADAVVIYDIHDEADRKTSAPRPFPFAETLDGIDWARLNLGPIDVPFVHFRCIAKYSKDGFGDQLRRLATQDERTPDKRGADAMVIAGGAAASQQLAVTMGEAYEMRKELAPAVLVGAVAIPERHAAKGDEHVRMLAKINSGVSFFLTQCVYNLEECKNMLSDYALHCRQNDIPLKPVLITLTPCGSKKTLEFLGWLGVRVSKWLTNDLLHTTRDGGILDESVEALLHMFTEIVHFGARKGIPIGCNIESVAVRKVEIEASLHLLNEAKKILEAARPLYDAYQPSVLSSPVTAGAGVAATA